MSNTEAANIYADIIEDVISESRQDFENSGIDEATLQDLRKIWMEKLVLSQAANFPWAQQNNEENETLEDSNSLALNTNGEYGQVLQLQLQQQQEQLLLLIPPPMGQLPISDLNASVSTGMEYPTVTTTAKQEDSGLVLPSGGRIVSQGDGNFELTIEVESKDAATKYMNKLKRRNRKRVKIIQQADGANSDDDDDDDGDNEDGKNDEEDGFGSDDINSDLDDSDSLESEDDGDDQEGNIMLCLYDKVQRVKNKWKCNLKEGIASFNGKDYTFQKATSESEW